MPFSLRSALVLFCVAGIAACSLPSVRPQSPEAACRMQLARMDALTQAVAEPGLARVPGFDYLRANRFLASFANEVEGEALTTWVQDLRTLDREARADEALRAGLLTETVQAAESCAQRLLAADLADAVRIQELRPAVRVPDDYSTVARVFGAYPFAAPFLKRGIRGYHRSVQADYAGELTQPAGTALHLWTPQAHRADVRQVGEWMQRAAQDALGIPRFSPEEQAALLAAHAPSFWLEHAGPSDVPGRPVWQDGRAQFSAEGARLYTLLTYTRHGGRVLPQLVYLVWFAGRPAEGSLDIYAGDFDGLIWRVTLGADGRPWVYDTIHACGCYHYVFTARDSLRPRAQEDFWQEPVLYPQTAIGDGPFVLRLATGTHYLRRVLPLSAMAELSPQGELPLAPYRELTLLQNADGPPRHLFEPDGGLLLGSERGERFLLWPSGVPSPGTMRAWGRHATRFIGTGHFDAPFLLDELFEPLP